MEIPFGMVAADSNISTLSIDCMEKRISKARVAKVLFTESAQRLCLAGKHSML